MNLYDLEATRVGVKEPHYAARLFTWAEDTQTDLRSYFDLTDDEYAAFRDRAEWHTPGSTSTGGPTLRPTCDSCGIELVGRVTSTPEQAWCGMWFDHPDTPDANRRAGMVGHDTTTVYPAPSERHALAAQQHVKQPRRTA